MDNIDNMSKETMEEQFNKMCILTDDGKAKYWKPAVFGYAEDDREAPLDKFFPETVKQFIRTIRLKDREELKKKVGMLRQWLNEDRITDTNKMVSTEDLLHWLN